MNYWQRVAVRSLAPEVESAIRTKCPKIASSLSDFVLDRGAYELRRGDEVVPLQRIPLELLCLLVERRGQIVTREEILVRVWGKGVFVDSRIRHQHSRPKASAALGDDPEAPRFVVTVPARGYRFIAEVHQPEISRAEHIRPRSSALMVGREHELASLLSGLEDACAAARTPIPDFRRTRRRQDAAGG